MMDKDKFKNIVRHAIKLALLDKLAIEFEVSTNTIKRWADGITYPLPELMDVVAKFIHDNDEGSIAIDAMIAALNQFRVGELTRGEIITAWNKVKATCGIN
jgi:hypothetical protein